MSEKNKQIEIIDSNASGESEQGRIDVIWQGFGTGYSDGNIYKPDLYVLSIGVSEYEDKGYGLDLDYAHVDAAAISDAFESQRGGLYRNVHKRLLTNSEENRKNVLD